MALSRDSFWSFRIALTVLVTALVTVAVVLVTKFSLGLWSTTLDRSPVPELSKASVNVSLGRHQCAIPGNIITRANSKFVELAMIWPGAIGRTEDNMELFQEPNLATGMVHLRLEEHSVSVGTEERISRILQPAFTGVALTAPNGLSGHRFRPGSGFGTDILYVGEAGTNDRFMAFCDAPFDLTPQPETSFCQRMIQLTPDIRLEIRFHPKLLTDWQKMDETIVSLVRGYVTVAENTN